MKIQNDTLYRTDQLRALMVRVAEDELSAHQRKILRARVIYGRRTCGNIATEVDQEDSVLRKEDGSKAHGAIMTDLRIQPVDVLYVMFEDLCAQAGTFQVWDADRRTHWFDQCRQVLAEVPDVYQRLAWTYVLAQAFTRGLPGINFGLVLDLLQQPSNRRTP